MTPNQKAMVYWILERENIRLKKESGQPKPWSDNKVFQQTYFCNVNREHDTVTKWIRENWFYEYCPETYTFAMIIARIFNLPDTLRAIGQPTDDPSYWLDHAEDTLVLRKANGNKIWNGAYIVSTNGKAMDKLTYCIGLFRRILDEGWDPVAGETTLDGAHKALMKVEGLASFLAGQVVADLKNSRGHPLSKAKDWEGFSAFGPGSLRGLSWFFDEPVSARTYQEQINKAYDMLFWELPEEIINQLCMQNLQNCFCEYDKFMRVTNETGRSKRKYPGV